MNTVYDVIIIGGGVIGSSIAYFLTKEGHKPLVIDKGKTGQASRAAGGMLGAQVEFQEPSPLFELAIKSRAMFPNLQEELREISKVDIEINPTGMMRVAVSEEDREELLQRMAWQREAGYTAEWLENEDLCNICKTPLASTFGALFLPDDHQVRSPKWLQALVEATVLLGGAFMEETEVIDFVQEGGRICGVKTLDSTYFADKVVIAAGSWSKRVASYLGLNLPVFPEKGQSILVDTTPHVTEYTVFAPGTYLIPKANGQTYIGATSENIGFQPRPSLYNIEKLTTSAIKYIPELAKSVFSDCIAGYRPASHDGLPYLGEVAGYKGLYMATGHWRNGILLSPITGLVMMEVLLDRQPSVNLDPFSVNRIFMVSEKNLVPQKS